MGLECSSRESGLPRPGGGGGVLLKYVYQLHLILTLTARAMIRTCTCKQAYCSALTTVTPVNCGWSYHSFPCLP
jgi:hypothetical protein